uniref:Putative LAGLIDADG homing endonuclease n=1 Tax=Stephanosphaera pluvialis TaxID=51712 RepID=A0A0S2IDK5_9CHLO|nr:putative LAGLIDADG homing endonuclease [Stephanosphaera pluvialis]
MNTNTNNNGKNLDIDLLFIVEETPVSSLLGIETQSNAQEKPKKTLEEFENMFSNLDNVVIAWLAGLLQGEAYFGTDSRKRGKFQISLEDSNYTSPSPPPPAPFIKLEMIEQDIMTKVGELLDESVNEQNRRTVAGNKVYRVTVFSRKKVKIVLEAIKPYVIGEKTNTKIQLLLGLCVQHEQWVDEGGRVYAAKLANKASQIAKKNKT